MACYGKSPNSDLIKLLMMLKFILLLVVLSTTQLTAKVFGQRASINSKNISLKRLFEDLRKQTGFHFLYLEEDLAGSKPVSLSMNNAELETILDKALSPQSLRYFVRNNRIVIEKAPLKEQQVMVAEVKEQKKEISGVVVNAQGLPMQSVTVLLKGTTLKTMTDSKGAFSLELNGNDAVLQFTAVGFKAQEVRVTNERSIRVILEDQVSDLTEVVVVGYGTQKKSVVSAAISRVTADELDLGNPTNVQNALKGKVSGVQITSESGQPGANSKIRIRGTGTVNDAGPLYIVDGMPSYSGINYLNPSDIESIEVLKDAASAAIYGARGANGVILVSTKKGRQGSPTQMNYEFTYGIQNPERKINLLNSTDYQMLMNEMAQNSGKSPYFPTPSTGNTDWQEALTYKNAPLKNHKFSLSGGTDKSSFYASFSNVEQSGIFGKGYSDYERTNARLNYSTTLMDKDSRNWLNKVVFTTIANYAKERRKGSDIGNSEAGGLIASINMLPPTEAIYQTDPAKIKQYQQNFPNYIVAPNGMPYNIIDLNEINNPLAAMQVNNNQLRTPQYFGSNMNVDVSILPGLKLKSSLGLDWAFNSRRKVTPVYDLNTNNKNLNSIVEDLKSDSKFWQVENVLSYTKSWNKHNLNLLAGTTMSSYFYSDLSGTDYDLLVVDLNKAYIDIATGDRANERVNGGASEHKLVSVFGRASYNYDEKYLFEAVMRRDGSSNFGPKHKYAVFPSVSAGWVLTKEGFMANRPGWLDFAKIRASWGQNGNEAIGAFGYTSNMSVGYNAVIDGKVLTGAKTSGYVNEDLKWETSEQTDIGLDLRLFNGKFSFTADYFVKNTKDMLLWMQLPEYTGFRSMRVNYGAVRNEGVELEASYKATINKVNFGIGANASYVKNVVSNIGPDRVGLDIIGGGLGGTVTWMESGKPYGFFYGYVHDGIFQNMNEVNAHVNPKTGSLIQPNAKPGDVRFKDVNGDGSLDGNDRQMLGKPNPDWTFGLNLHADWKGFDVQAFLQGVAGNEIYKFYRRANITQANWDGSWLDRWHGEGTSNWMPRLVEGDPNHNTTWVSNLFVEKGDYVRLKVLQVGYSLPEAAVKKLWMSRLRVFAQGENLWTWTKYSGYDPEVGTRNGFDGGTYPQAKIFTIGASVTF